MSVIDRRQTDRQENNIVKKPENKIKLKVNGELKEFDSGTTLTALLDLLGVDNKTGGIAVAVNDGVVVKNDWSRTNLSDGDTVEIIRAVQGG